MIRRIALLILLSLTLLTLSPSPSQAQEGVAVVSSAEADFPTAIAFNLQAEAAVDITGITLYYRVQQISPVPVISVVEVEFTPSPEVETSWTWELAETLPLGAKIQYWWLIEDAAGEELKTEPEIVSFDDERYSWYSLAAGDLTLFWYRGDQPFAQALLNAATDALDRLAQDTGVELEQPVAIYVYGSPDELQASMLYPQEWTGGVAFTGYGVIVIGVAPQDLAWGQRALAHELAHLVVHQMTSNPYGNLPTWLDEGLATYAEGAPSPQALLLLGQAVSEGRLFSVRSLSSSFPGDPREAALSYAESASLVRFLLESLGRQRLLQLLSVFREGRGYDEALMEVYGFDRDELGARWQESLGLAPEPVPSAEGETLSLKIIAAMALATALPLAAAFLLRRRRRSR